MDFPIDIDTISMGLPIVYFKVSHVQFSKLWCNSVPEDCFNLSKQCRPWWNATFIMQHFIWVFTVCKSTPSGVSHIQRFKPLFWGSIHIGSTYWHLSKYIDSITSHWWAEKAQTSLHICTISPDPLLLAYTKYGSTWSLRPKFRPLAPLG